MELEKHEGVAQVPDIGAVEAMHRLGEEGIEGACPTHHLDGDGETDDTNDENGEIQDNDDPSEDAKSDTSSTASCGDEPPPLNLNYEALKYIADNFLPGSHGPCVDITSMRPGGFHEIRVLHFEDGWSCIARFTIEYEVLQKTESELATIEYVRKNTTIPVPEIYFINHNENHVVGSAFVLMERMDGEQLCNVWSDLSLKHKLDVIEQLANVTGQLADQKFDKIGVITKDGTIGPLLSNKDPTQTIADHAFTSTIDSYLAYLENDNPKRTEAAKKLYHEARDEIRSFFEHNATNPLLHAPYRLMHGDYGSQNILVVQADNDLPPKISAIIDWDLSQTIEVEALYEYPGWIIDDNSNKAEDGWAKNKVLRKHFVASLMQHYPQDSPERKLVKQCFREKSYILTYFGTTFMWDMENEESAEKRVRGYLNVIRGQTDEMFRHPYDRLDWKIDSDLEDSDAESGDEETSRNSDGELES